MADSQKHFGVDETNVSFEQQIRRDVRFTVTGIWRDYMNFLGSTLPAARWSTIPYLNPKTNQNMNLYRWANRPGETVGADYLIQNLDGYRFYDENNKPIPGASPNRKYKGAMFVLNKTLSNNWQGQFSYVWSETTGNINNAGRSGFGGAGVGEPDGRARQHRRQAFERPHARAEDHGRLQHPEDRRRAQRVHPIDQRRYVYARPVEHGLVEDAQLVQFR